MADPDLQTRAATPAAPLDKASYDDALKCNRCGFCTSFCPTYLATGDETLSPRGRNQTLRALLENRLPDPAQAKRSFDTCLLCGICTSVCFSEVPTAKLMSAGREKLLERRGEPWLLRLVLRELLPRPWLFEPLLRWAMLGKRLGVSGLLRRLGILRLLSPQLAAADEMTETVPLRFLRGRLRRPGRMKEAQVVQFLACGPNYVRPSVGLATADVLRRAGVLFGAVKNVCCGLPGVSFGDLEAARALAQKNIQELEKVPKAAVLVDDSSCAAAVKDYPGLFPPENPWHARAAAVAARTKDFVEWCAENNVPLPPAPKGVPVAYHDPCKARYGQKIVDAPRRLLKSMGADCRDVPEAEQCCGGGGTYSFVQPEISRAVLARKTAHIRSTGAAVVLTSGVSCLLQLAFGLRRAKSSMKAVHLAEFLAKPEAFGTPAKPSKPVD